MKWDFEDGAEGWVAHVFCGTGLELACPGASSPVLIKTFPDIDASSFVPGEAEVEIYANDVNTYIEVEDQGPYEPVPAGGSVSWTVRWYLRYLPSDITPQAGNVDLLDFVRGQIL